MEDYIDARFRNHPCIAPVIIFHVFKTCVTQVSNNNNVKHLEGWIAKLESLGSNRTPKGTHKDGKEPDTGKKNGKNGHLPFQHHLGVESSVWKQRYLACIRLMG
jgi:hypothetical protein